MAACKSAAGLGRGVELLFEEAFGDLPGRQSPVDRLVEYVLILVLRDVVKRELVQCRTLRGLSDERLSKALMAMHQHPEGPWDLGRLGEVAGMSRAHFAAYFREVVGATPMGYLTSWRMAVVQTMRRMGEPLKSNCAGRRIRELDGVESYLYTVNGADAHRVGRPQQIQPLSSGQTKWMRQELRLGTNGRDSFSGSPTNRKLKTSGTQTRILIG